MKIKQNDKHEKSADRKPTKNSKQSSYNLERKPKETFLLGNDKSTPTVGLANETSKHKIDKAKNTKENKK